MIKFTRDISTVDVNEGALLLVDKPLNWTSFDVVNKIRFTIKHSINVKKYKVGHAGTLDPLATGLLLICIGKYTKKINELTDLDKSYTGTLKLGATTKSYDSELDEDESFPIEHITEEAIRNNVHHFMGEQEQLPPVYSAVKIDGIASYKRTRQGEDVKMKPRTITIHDFKVTNMDMPNIEFVVTSSKGTYIRSLAHDFGKRLDSGAYLTALRRTSTAGYNIADAWQLPDLIDEIKNKLAQPI